MNKYIILLPLAVLAGGCVQQGPDYTSQVQQLTQATQQVNQKVDALNNRLTTLEQKNLTATSTSSVPTDWKTYRNDIAGYEISYPNLMQLDSTYASDEKMVHLVRIADLQPPQQLEFFGQEDFVLDITYAKDLQLNEELKEPTYTKIDLHGISAYRATNENGSPMAEFSATYIIKSNGKKYTLSFSFGNRPQLAEQLLKSFRLVP